MLQFKTSARESRLEQLVRLTILLKQMKPMNRICGDLFDSRISGYVVIRELSESETINGKFTHFGYLRGLNYGE